jgi:hypothetical protein
MEAENLRTVVQTPAKSPMMEPEVPPMMKPKVS